MKSIPREHETKATLAYGGIWALLWLDWTAWHILPAWLLFIGFLPTLYFLWHWGRTYTQWRPYVAAIRSTKGLSHKVEVLLQFSEHVPTVPPIPFRWRCTLLALPAWQFLVFFTWLIGARGLSGSITSLGTILLFLVGLAWVVWFVDGKAQKRIGGRTAPRGQPLEAMSGDLNTTHKAIWNPLDLEAWYYGRHQRKLKQSLLTVFTYGLAFTFTALFLASLSGCRELYEMPAGGGEVAQLQQVKVQKVIKKKFVINPFSAILFNPPPIEEVELQLNELTKHAYTVGYGKGTGAGFSGGTNRGAVRFIRLEYNGGDWDQDFGIGADLNLLIEYHVRTRHKVAKTTESRKISQLGNFPKGKSPPMAYMTGQRNISISKKERDILREYLTDKHGMIFADNGGSRHWHGQFFNVMKSVLPDVRPIKIPLDHDVHTIPYQIPFLPYVAPHGGKDAYGWVVNGRLAAYYHPGDIGDAWSDGHAGVKPEIWELCYQLGVNVIFYAHAEYNRWLDGQNQE